MADDTGATRPPHDGERRQPSLAEQGRALRQRQASTFSPAEKPLPGEHHAEQPLDPNRSITGNDLHAAIAPLLTAIQDLEARVAALEQQPTDRTRPDSDGK